MPGWLMWTFIGLAAWCAVSIVFAFVVGHLIARGRTTESRGRVVVLAGAGSARVRMRGRGHGLRKVG